MLNCRRIILAGLSICTLYSQTALIKIRRIFTYIFRIGRDCAQIQWKKESFSFYKEMRHIWGSFSSFVNTIRSPHLLNFQIFLTMLIEDRRNFLVKINKPVVIKLNAVFNWFMANKIIPIIPNPAIVRFNMAPPYREGGDVEFTKMLSFLIQLSLYLWRGYYLQNTVFCFAITY